MPIFSVGFYCTLLQYMNCYLHIGPAKVTKCKIETIAVKKNEQISLVHVLSPKLICI